MTRYTYQTGVSFGGDTPTAEFDVELAFSFIRGRPETPAAYDHGGLPADPDLVEDIEVVKVDGKPRPWDLCGVSDDELADHILDHLGDIEPDLLSHAIETSGSMGTFGRFRGFVR